MRERKLIRNALYAALAVIAIGAAVYAASPGGGDHGTATPEGQVEERTGSSSGDLEEPGDGAGSANTERTAADVDEGASSTGGDSLAQADEQGSGPVPGGVQTSTLDRKIVQTASLQLQVDEVGASFEDAGRIANSAGGFVASSSFSYEGERQVASVTIRVPSDSYQDVLSRLRSLGVKVDAENSDASDVTEEYTDLTSRLRNLEATETQLLALLERAETITDILTVQDRLNTVRAEVEQVKGRIQLLDNLSSLATVTVHLRPVAIDGGGAEPGSGVDLGAEVSQAWDESLEFLGGIAAGVITVVVFAWWLPIVALPCLVAYRALTRNRPQRAEAVD